jgi:fructose-specific phosphotransferase system IIC component
VLAEGGWVAAGGTEGGIMTIDLGAPLVKGAFLFGAAIDERRSTGDAEAILLFLWCATAAGAEVHLILFLLILTHLLFTVLESGISFAGIEGGCQCRRCSPS